MNFFGARFPLTLIGGVAVIVVGAVLSGWWLLGSRDVVLFDRLEPASLEAVSTELARAGIAHGLDRDTGTVTVAADHQQRARLAVMSSGNAFHEAVGFELFNGSDFGMTEFAQKINYQRAIEGELARTITALEEVKYARVHLVLPEHGLFRKQPRESRAAITVFLENGATLSADQIRGIQRIAASAVPELAERDVSVTDERGRILSAGNSALAAELDAGGRLAQKQAVERYLGEKVRGVLAKALGAERFAVSVDVTLDFTRKTTRTERVLDGGSGAGIQRIKESSHGEGGAELPGSDHLKEVEYSLGHELEQVEHGSGTIQQMQVAVIVDRDLENVDVAQLRELVAAAIGIDPQRGDKVAVVRHGVAVQRILEQAGRAEVTSIATPVPVRSVNIAELIREVPRWLWAAVALLLASSGIAAATSRAIARRRQQRVDQLRLRLQDWIEAEHAEVTQ